uniref:MORC family CW-type zinc finger protein 3a n=1 Tax=Scatophagus argus TaxID=75038 RepID=UPI001ED7EDB0|nr:MORC family CW-type zinc finger protein 3a [Scatophagus argus]
MAAQSDRGVPLSTLCPKYLHTNSTSHTWPFGAIAELIDNAYDPDVNAKQFWIDKTVVKGQECLIFMDNGNGLDQEAMHKMLSFGYSDKKPLNGVQPIGTYGNGFKSGSMRLGRDAIVFSKSKSATCIGMLSQTYLEKINATQISVPIICFEQGETNDLSVRQEHKASLQDIMRFSPFKTVNELLLEVNAIICPGSEETTGTRIIIWNLRRTSETTEFDFETDRYDIRIPSGVCDEMKDTSVMSCIPESFYSLRAYCSILYLKPRMQVIIRGQKVRAQLIDKNLAYSRKDGYKPTFLNKRIRITFGYNTKSKDQYGVMMYHKNRLIKAYERVGCQLKANYKGVGVIGVIECNFLNPTHNKQSFDETDKYRKTMNSLAIKLEEYWQEIRHKRKQEDPNSIPVEDTIKRPDQNWAQCDDCLKWRKLPDGIDCSKLPDKWYCRMNPDPQFRSCQVEEEPEDDDEEPSYQKTYKQQEREDKKNKEKERLKAEEDRKRQEKHVADLVRENQDLKRKLYPVPAPSMSRSPTLKGMIYRKTPEKRTVRPKSSSISQAACSPSSSKITPVISDVRSLSARSPRGKRTQPATLQRTPKRPKVNGCHSGTTGTSTSVDVSPLSSSVPIYDGDDTDDEIFILETASTPKPQRPSFELTKIKTEEEQSDISIPMEATDDVAPEAMLETNGAGTSPAGSAAVETSPSPASPAEMTSSTTQTEFPKVKKEENLSQTIGETLQTGETYPVENEDDAGPSCADAWDKRDSPTIYPNMMEVQEQQDQLLELMQATAQERDSFKEQVRKLTSQLQDAQNRLQEVSQISVKKTYHHQASQTEETQEEKDYKSLFERAKEKVAELIKDKESLLATTESKSSAVQSEEKDIDEIALQVDRLVRELDQRNKERDELRSQLDSLEEERTNLATRCEELKLSLQQQRENTEIGSTTPHRATDSSGHTDPDRAEASSKSLIELRQSIGRLLVSFVPALDLGQVNYECNVIDEILEQVLTSLETESQDELNK